MRASVRGLRALVARWQGDAGGTVAVIFAAVAIPIVGIVAASIDYGRASKVSAMLQRAGDEAVQMAALQLDEGEDALRRLVRIQLDANLPNELRQIPFTLTLPADRSSVSIAIGTSVPTSLLGVMGVQRLEASAQSTARRPAIATLPVAQPGAGPSPLGSAPAIHARPGNEEVAREVQRAFEALPPELARAVEQFAAEAQKRDTPQAIEVERLLRELNRR